MSLENISSMRLAAADSAKFFNALRQLDPLPISVRDLEPKATITPSKQTTTNEASGSNVSEDSSNASHVNVGEASINVPLPQGQQLPSTAVNTQVLQPSVNADVD
jgi:hypothetical protein